jgi:tetratricopeptide (TPR) repeat protein
MSRVERQSDPVRALATLAVLAAAVGAVYWRALDAPFVFDDVPGIVTNPSLVRLWPPIGDERSPGPLNPPGLAPTSRRPLVNLTFAIDRRLHGLEPAPYRAENVVLHVLSALLLATIVLRTLRLRYFGGAWTPVVWPLSLGVALLWALHPLDTEAVAYVTQRTELLAALCYLATLWAALRYWSASSRRARGAWVAFATLACLAGVASKEIVVSAPLVVLLYERTFLVGSWRGVRRSWPLYAGLSLGWLLLGVLNAGGVSGLTDPRHHVPVHVWWMTQAKVVFLYLKLAVWPWPLSIHYAPRYLRTFADAWPWVAAALALAVATAVLVWRRPALRPAVAAIVLVLAPTLVVPLPKMMAAERRMYLPLAGLVALAVTGGWRAGFARRPRAGAAALGALVVAAGAVTVHRLAVYETAVALWRDAATHQPDDPMAHYNLGVALVAENRLDEAMHEFERTLALDPDHGGALDNLGMVLKRLGRPADAVVRFERALRVDRDDTVAHNNLGAALIDLGRAEDAIPHLARALADEPQATVHLNMGRALIDVGRADDGLRHLEEAVRLGAGDADAQYSLGVTLTKVGRPRDAVPHLERAVGLRSDDAEAHDALATALLASGEPEPAVGHYRRALELRPESVETRNNLGAALLALHRPDEAIRELEIAVRARPEHANAHYNLATALLDVGRADEAGEHFRETVRLSPNDARAEFGCARAYAGTKRPSDATTAATTALTLARAQGDAALADEIAGWLRSQPR